LAEELYELSCDGKKTEALIDRYATWVEKEIVESVWINNPKALKDVASLESL
jgi:hypothetical protein